MAKEKKPTKEIKDLSKLANIKIEDVAKPESEEVILEKAIEKGEDQVNIIVEEIKEDAKKGLEKSEILGGEKSRVSLEKDLESIAEEKEKILENLPGINSVSEKINNIKKTIDLLKEEGKKDAEELAKLQEEENPSNQNENLKNLNKIELEPKSNEENQEIVEVFNLEKELKEAKDRVNQFVDTKIEELKNKIVNGTATGDDFEELESINNKEIEIHNLENIEEKNDLVLNELQKQQQEKVKKFFEDQAKQKEQGENKTGFFKKTLDWWNNLDQSRGGKITKTIMSAGFIGTALYFAGDKLDILPKNQTVAQKIGSRTFLAGLSSSIVTSNFTKNTLGSIKEKWSKLGTTGKIVAGTALGVGGAGAFVYFAGATTVGITIGAIATKLGINKVLFDKKIDNLKIEKEKSEKRIEELNAKIQSFENDPNFDVEALMKELPEIQSELDKYNNKLRNWKIW